uniref:YkgJ family cysteine cluster protein n=1 Tax=Odontella aurita TaxID=265563 RepID=A0A7S4MC41_9STRA|mmetsp:Transcript_17089/g.49382  ORF Transcript_17089/g.49382 Transcript_17089/m.49382 type:complete len:329 (+) Transcript_17089:207-1193(+)
MRSTANGSAGFLAASAAAATVIIFRSAAMTAEGFHLQAEYSATWGGSMRLTFSAGRLRNSGLRASTADGGGDGPQYPPPLLPWMNAGQREESDPWFVKADSDADVDGERKAPPPLPFECTGCGKCCKTRGDVYLSPSETRSAAALLGLSIGDFKRRYVAEEEVTAAMSLDPLEPGGETGWTVLRHREGDGSCVFLGEDNMCGIYEARPLQCSTYPFWPRIMASRELWNEEVRLVGEGPSEGKEVEEEGTAKGRYWTAEEGGCEGMIQINADGRVAADAEHSNMGGVDATEARITLELYERYKRRFPRTELRHVERESDETQSLWISEL